MYLLPAIDLRDGRVIRLEQGDYDRQTDYAVTGLQQAQAYQAAGAQRLHLVDLDAALDGGDGNLDQIRTLCNRLDIPVQTGGGVRDRADVQTRLAAGAERIVIGSVCVRAPETVCDWLQHFGPECIVAGLDVLDSDGDGWIPRASGWTERGEHDLFQLLDLLTGAGLMHLLCTDISRDGMLSGPSVALYTEIAERYPDLRIQASGGIGQPEHLEQVSRTGVDACIVGRALLEGLVPLEAIRQYNTNPCS